MKITNDKSEWVYLFLFCHANISYYEIKVIGLIGIFQNLN